MAAPQVEIRFPGTHDGFAQGFDRLREALDGERFGAPLRYNIELVFEEIVANIVGYGAPDGHPLQVAVLLAVNPDAIVLTFEDNGVAFDPRSCAQPERPASLDEARVGGFGLMLVRHAASSLDYQRGSDARNRLTVTLPRADGDGQRENR